ncbi:MAG: hypothetical protein E8D47_10700 [Nitrospira sp.]|nr:MAG: hypothetical protein E8D47_10700 [Nitrospira sp.]
MGIQVRVGDWEGAYREVMSEQARKDDDLKHDLLIEMARAQASLGDVSGAFRTIRETLVLGRNALSSFSALCQIIKEQGRIADKTMLHAALDLAERTSAEQLAKEKAEHPTGSFALTWLTDLAEAQAAGGRRERADQTLQLALDLVSSDAFNFRQSEIDHGYANILTVQAHIGDISGALKTLEKMSDQGRRYGMRWIIAILADAGDLARALAFVAQIDEPESKTRALLSIASTQAQYGDSVGAQKTLARIESLTDRGERSELLERQFYSTLAKVQCDRDSAPRVLTQILQDVDKAQLGGFIVYEAVGEAYAAVGLVAEALQIFERIPREEDRDGNEKFARDALARMITKAHTVAGNVEVAEAWVRTLQSPSEQCYAWLGIVDGFVSLSSISNRGTAMVP